MDKIHKPLIISTFNTTVKDDLFKLERRKGAKIKITFRISKNSFYSLRLCAFAPLRLCAFAPLRLCVK